MRRWLDDLIAKVTENPRLLRAVVYLFLFVPGLVFTLSGVWRTKDWEGLLLNLGTELIGAGVTYFLLDRVLRRWEERSAKKADLIAQMGSRVHDVAIAAVEELRRQRWLRDGSLKGAFLWGANLQGADVNVANLQGAILWGTNLQGARLDGTNLQEAELYRANLQGATLLRTNLQGARLDGANLQEAELMEADLQGTDLRGADLQRARLEQAKFDENTRLPDHTMWSPDTDMPRFTDPEHPDFWRSDDQRSPAYQPSEGDAGV